VISKAGRDKGRSFIVVAQEGEFVYLCDGDLRKSDCPKKKKRKHLASTNIVCDYIGDKIKDKKKVIIISIHSCNIPLMKFFCFRKTVCIKISF